MRYDKRCTLIKILEIPTPLGIEEREITEIKSCFIQNISIEEEQTYYGQASKHRLKVHVRGVIKGVQKVLYETEKYEVIKIRNFKRKTVIYIERSGHDET